MLRFHVTDRRLNPSGKNMGNRKRFIERIRKNIDTSKGLKDRGISDTGDQDVTVSKDSIDEPHFQYDRKQGSWDHLLPGNKKYNVGDGIPRPEEGGGGQGSKGSPDGDGEDDFRFALSQEEYMDILFADLQLPDMVKDTEKHTISYTMRRAGYTPVGAASNLALEQSMIKSISRRLALKKPKLLLLTELEEELENETDEERRLELQDQISRLRVRANAIPFLDKTDLRYHNTVKQALPITQAVMYCVDGETEYLSETGWNKISSYTDGKVAQYNIDGSIEFVDAIYVKNDYHGEFIKITSQYIDQLITPDHRVIYKDVSDNLSVMIASDLELWHNEFDFNGKFIIHNSNKNGEEAVQEIINQPFTTISLDNAKITRVVLHDKHSYCFSVPSGMLVLRRNSNIFVSGNCLMDTSGSMTEHMKDLSKRFYILLYIFLKRIYKDVEVVFIRHTHTAEIVDEDTFFHSPETGGTVVSSAYETMRKDIIERFPVDEWNIYAAQASDGDNYESDNNIAKKYLDGLIPWIQYLTYVEVGRSDNSSYRDTEVWKMMAEMISLYPDKIAMRKIKNKDEVVPVFRSLFTKREATK